MHLSVFSLEQVVEHLLRNHQRFVLAGPVHLVVAGKLQQVKVHFDAIELLDEDNVVGVEEDLFVGLHRLEQVDVVVLDRLEAPLAVFLVLEGQQEFQPVDELERVGLDPFLHHDKSRLDAVLAQVSDLNQCQLLLDQLPQLFL